LFDPLILQEKVFFYIVLSCTSRQFCMIFWVIPLKNSKMQINPNKSLNPLKKSILSEGNFLELPKLAKIHQSTLIHNQIFIISSKVFPSILKVIKSLLPVLMRFLFFPLFMRIKLCKRNSLLQKRLMVIYKQRSMTCTAPTIYSRNEVVK